jgi:hypothetical protein
MGVGFRACAHFRFSAVMPLSLCAHKHQDSMRAALKLFIPTCLIGALKALTESFEAYNDRFAITSKAFLSLLKITMI